MDIPSVKDFLNDYFRARTEWNRAIGLLYEPLAKRFLAPSYSSIQFEKWVQNSKEETILSCERSGAGAQVITTSIYGAGHRMRYHLSTVAATWQIEAIERECGLCHGTGQREGGGMVVGLLATICQPPSWRECPSCEGKGWRLIGEVRTI
jgi:hypothetical protein